MKHFLLFLYLFTCSLLTATPLDDMRRAIITSDLERVLELIPKLSEQEKASFTPLAQAALNKREKEYEISHIIPPISFTTLSTFAAGLATYFCCKSNMQELQITRYLMELAKSGLELTKTMADNPILLKYVEDLNTPELVQGITKTLQQQESKLSFAYVLNKIGIAAGIGLVATSVWLLFLNKQNIHDAYTNALEIKHLLTQPTTMDATE